MYIETKDWIEILVVKDLFDIRCDKKNEYVKFHFLIEYTMSDLLFVLSE